ncbi:MAG: hypothetical protein QFB86_00560 [Patescibacteria group bacterium]|nr:hypothetical protein [Patescibacteria group bacterium]
MSERSLHPSIPADDIRRRQRGFDIEEYNEDPVKSIAQLEKSRLAMYRAGQRIVRTALEKVSVSEQSTNPEATLQLVPQHSTEDEPILLRESE